jgi:WD40 repeat protein
MDGQVVSWDIETGHKHIGFQVGEDHRIRCFNGGRNIVSVSKTRTITLWNAETGERLQDLLKVPNGSKTPMASFSPDGCYMAWADAYDRDIQIWKLVDGKPSRVLTPSPWTHKQHHRSLFFRRWPLCSERMLE